MPTKKHTRGSYGGFQKTGVQYRDGPSNCYHCSDVTLFLHLAPHRLKLVQMFLGPSVEREPQNPSIPRATVSRSCSAATTQGRTGAGGSRTGQQVTWPLSLWVMLAHCAQPSWGSGWEMRGTGLGLPWGCGRTPSSATEECGARYMLPPDSVSHP